MRIVFGLALVAGGALVVWHAPRLARQTWTYRRRPGPLKAAFASAGFQVAGLGFAAGGVLLVIQVLRG